MKITIFHKIMLIFILFLASLPHIGATNETNESTWTITIDVPPRTRLTPLNSLMVFLNDIWNIKVVEFPNPEMPTIILGYLIIGVFVVIGLIILALVVKSLLE